MRPSRPRNAAVRGRIFHRHSIYPGQIQDMNQISRVGSTVSFVFYEKEDLSLQRHNPNKCAFLQKRDLDDFRHRVAHLASDRSTMSNLDDPTIFQRPIQQDKQDGYGVEAGTGTRGDTEDVRALGSTLDEQHFVIPEG